MGEGYSLKAAVVFSEMSVILEFSLSVAQPEAHE